MKRDPVVRENGMRMSDELAEKLLIDPRDALSVGPCLRWYVNSYGYAAARWTKTVNCHVTNGSILLHRLIMGATDPSVFVDHINGNRLDNRRSNLRMVTAGQNGMNAKVRKDSTSGVRGVLWHKTNRRWVASIKINGRRISLGSHKAMCEAVLARQQAEEKYYGKYAHRA